MKAPKQVILDTLKRELGSVEDDFARAKIESRSMPKDEKYGQSGQTLRQTMERYLGRWEEIKNAIIWTNTL